MRGTRTSVEPEGRIGWAMVLAGRPGCEGCASGRDHLLIGRPRKPQEVGSRRTGIRDGLERYCQRSGAVSASGSCPAGPHGLCGASVVTAAAIAVTNRREDSVKLTDTQQVLLLAASRRDDRGLERPPHLVGGAAGKVVAKLLAEGLIEEVQSRGSLPIWRSEEDSSRSLHMTKRGLQAIADERAGDAPTKKPPAPSANRRKSATAPIGPRKRRRGEQTRADTKQASVIALLSRPQGTNHPHRWCHHRRVRRPRPDAAARRAAHPRPQAGLGDP
jgi:hypothetical protein